MRLLIAEDERDLAEALTAFFKEISFPSMRYITALTLTNNLFDRFYRVNPSRTTLEADGENLFFSLLNHWIISDKIKV